MAGYGLLRQKYIGRFFIIAAKTTRYYPLRYDTAVHNMTEKSIRFPVFIHRAQRSFVLAAGLAKQRCNPHHAFRPFD